MFDKENIMKIDFIEKTDYYEIECIALFNKTKISDEEVEKAIKLHRMGENPYVIFMSKEQFENIFFKEGINNVCT